LPDDLYSRDVLTWAEQQAALLRRLAAGERLNEAVDWPNVIEEVQDVGLSELRACKSLLVQAFVHLLKLHAWPNSQAVAHWRGEAASFLASARRSFTPSMRQRVDLSELYADALYELKSRLDDTGEPTPFSNKCPFTLDDLLSTRPDIATLVSMLAAAV